ncbi:MAG: hypothetical protein ACR2FY_15835 [Pirellulaceae bacterium]
MITFSCSSCGKLLTVKEELAGKTGKCPVCQVPITVPKTSIAPAAAIPAPPSPPAARVRPPAPSQSPASPTAREPVILQVVFPGKFFWIDMEVQVSLDGKLIGTGFLKKGVNVQVQTTPGSHTLETEFMSLKQAYQVNLTAGGTYVANLRYSALVGNFTSTLDLRAPGGAAVTAERPSATAAAAAPTLGRLAVFKGSACEKCDLWHFPEVAICSSCQGQTVSVPVYERFCWERLAFIGMWFLIGLPLALIHPGFLATGLVVAFLYGMANFWLHVGGLTERFGPKQMEDWVHQGFSWKRFGLEFYYSIGVVIAAVIAFVIICLVVGFGRLLE